MSLDLTRVSLALLVAPLACYAQLDPADAELLRVGAGKPIDQIKVIATAESRPNAGESELAAFLHRRGTANLWLGRYSQAMLDLKRAPKVIWQGGAPDGWGDAWRIEAELGETFAAAGDWFGAIAHWERLAARSSPPEPSVRHMAQLGLSRSYGILGLWTQARRGLKAAEDLLPELERHPAWPRIEARVLYQHAAGNAHWAERQGLYDEAERFGRAAWSHARRDLEAARRSYEPDHRSARTAIENLASALVDLGRILALRGKTGEAHVRTRAGLQERLQFSAPQSTSVSAALETLAYVSTQEGDAARAERYARLALSLQERSDVPEHSTHLAARRAQLAYVLALQERWPEALGLFEQREHGLRMYPDQLQYRGAESALWALVLHKAGHSTRAEAMGMRVIAELQRRPVPNAYRIAQAQGVIGLAQAAAERFDQALQSFQSAIPQLLRRDADDSPGWNVERAFWRRVIVEGYLDLLGRLYAAGSKIPGLDLSDEAFRMADIARESVVHAAIVSSLTRARLPDATLAAWAREEQDTVTRIRALNDRIARLSSGADGTEFADEITSTGAELVVLRAQHARLFSRIQQRFPRYAELLNPQPLGLAAAAGMLAADEALVSIYLGETRAYVWTIMPGRAPSFRVAPVARRDVERQVAALRRALDLGDGDFARLPAFDVGVAHRLFAALLGPEAALWGKARVLNIIPHGALARMPFAALVTRASPQPEPGPHEGYRDVAWLANHVAIAQIPSATAFAALRRAPAPAGEREPFIGFGAPLIHANPKVGSARVRNLGIRKQADEFDARLERVAMGRTRLSPFRGPVRAPGVSRGYERLSALPETADELTQIARVLNADPERDVFVGRRATERNVREARLDNRKVIAFATHGLAPGDLFGLDQPALVLSNPDLTGEPSEDGFLTMEEILGLKLDAALVVLSACDTGGGDGRSAEALSGLGRAFFYAGARSLLVSSWAVENTSARRLTTELFRRQAADPALTPAQALRESMLALMREHAPAPSRFSYAHPAFWAPFSLVGDGRL